MSAEEYDFRPVPPEVADYVRLRRVAGLHVFPEELARRGLAATIRGVTVLHGGRAVGMGRIIGDGGCFHQIVDIAVDPDHQGAGLGRRIVEALMDYVNALPDGSYVSLIADTPANELYEEFGFRETAPDSLGMKLIVGQAAR